MLIIGGGTAGLEAAITCSNAGARAIVVEHSAIVGGKLAAPLVDRSRTDDDISIPDLSEIRAQVASQGIEIITLADIDSIEGSAGDFTVSIHERARFVTDACTRCNKCPQVCPQVAANEFDANLTFRKAIYTPLIETLPAEFVVDIDCCLNTPPNYLPCQRCVDICDDNAIDFDMALDKPHKRQVAAIIVTVGFEVADDPHLQEFGYGKYTDVITAMELQRLLQTPGPTGGFAAKPSNEEYPERILLVLHHISPYTAYIMSNQIRSLSGQDIDEISLLILEQKEECIELNALESVAAEAGVSLCRGGWTGIKETNDNGLCIGYVNLVTGQVTEQEFDMVVLSSDVAPPDCLGELATTLEINLTDSGYIELLSSNTTSRDGIYAAGCATGPMEAEQSMEQGRLAAVSALGCCSSQLPLEIKPHQKDPGWRELTQAQQRLRVERLLKSLIELGES